jgi:N-carbamoyl-L-amino-acid hydrolase
MLFQFRDADQQILNQLHGALVEIVNEFDAEGPCPVTLEIMSQSNPAIMAPSTRNCVLEAAQALAPKHYRVMPSGAGHDAQIIAPHIPSAMMFVPSIGGISHHWSENTSDEDLMLGVQIYVDAIARILESH